MIISKDEFINREMQILTFYDEPSHHMRIKISHDLQKVAFCNGQENYMLEIDEFGNTLQKNLPELKGKTVRHIACAEDGSDFYLVCCHDYDTGLEVQSTSDINYH